MPFIIIIIFNFTVLTSPVFALVGKAFVIAWPQTWAVKEGHIKLLCFLEVASGVEGQ